MKYEDGVRYRFNPFARNYVATAGLMNWIEEHQAHWLMDIIASYKVDLMEKKADYLKICEMVVDVEKSSGVFTISDEINGELVRQVIEYTDLTENIKIWAIDEGDLVVCLLPEEY
jgi:hypothetical protein